MDHPRAAKIRRIQAKEKARATEAAPSKFSLYFQNIKLQGVNRKGLATLYLLPYLELIDDRVIFAY
jgi:hypothetical protein